MNKRTPTKKPSFDGNDPQESLIKSLESIKSLLKQGDSKINEARESIARADSIGNDTMETRLNESSSEIPNPAFISSESIQQPNILEMPVEHELNENIDNDINDEIEEILVESVPDYNTSNPKSAELAIPNIDSNIPQTDNVADNTSLNDFYDHDLIVPMLDEIVIPEDQNSSLFNMDSSVEIKLDSKSKSKLLDLNDNKPIKVENNSKLTTDVAIKNSKDELIKSEFTNIKKTEIKTKADIISFELSSNLKKNNLTKLENNNVVIEKPNLNIPKSQKNISLVDDSLVGIQLNTKNDIQNKSSLDSKLDSKLDSGRDQVIIKETTRDKMPLDKISSSLNTKLTNKKVEVTENINSPKVTISKTDISPAIDSATYTDEILSSITNTNNKPIKKNTSTQATAKNINGEIDYSTFDGLDRLKFNADKMSALQKRVEKRVHNRLIQFIVQLDDEIKSIFTDEIKNCIAHELKNSNDDK